MTVAAAGASLGNDRVWLCRVGSQGEGQGVTLEGPLAGALRRAAYLYRQPTTEHRLSVGVSWLQKAAEDAASMAQSALSGGPPLPSSKRR
jgi:NADH dehydrogenase FAD-containing subunit